MEVKCALVNIIKKDRYITANKRITRLFPEYSKLQSHDKSTTVETQINKDFFTFTGMM